MANVPQGLPAEEQAFAPVDPVATRALLEAIDPLAEGLQGLAIDRQRVVALLLRPCLFCGDWVESNGARIERFDGRIELLFWSDEAQDGVEMTANEATAAVRQAV